MTSNAKIVNDVKLEKLQAIMNNSKHDVSKYWTLDEISKVDADINIIMSGKGAGKSYNVKKYLTARAYLGMGNFVVYRRFKTHVTDIKIKGYFADLVCNKFRENEIEKMTNGEFNRVYVRQQIVYFARLDVVTKQKKVDVDAYGKPIYEEYEDEVLTKGPEFCRFVLLTEQGYDENASQAWGIANNYNRYIFEEFESVSSSIRHIDNEPTLFMKMNSTIFRDRDDVKGYLLCNRISRIKSPYFKQWGLENVIKQKPGTIEIYKFREWSETLQQQIITKIAVESIKTTGVNDANRQYFGAARKSVIGDEFDTKANVPTLSDSFKNYISLYEIKLDYSVLSYSIMLKVDPKTGAQFVFISPITRTYRFIRRVISDKFSLDPFTTTCFDKNIPAEVTILELIRKGKVAYSDDRTGTDVPEILKKILIMY